MWKFLDPVKGEQMVAMDRSVIGVNRRMHVEITDRGSKLTINLAEETDAGQYICQMGATSTRAIKHTVRVRGE